MTAGVRIPATIFAIVCLTCGISEALTLPGPVLQQQAPTPVALSQPNPTSVREEVQNAQPSIIADNLPTLRQGIQTPVQGMISTLTSMVGGLVPYLRRPETPAAAKPVEKPQTTKEAEEKVAHLDHDHVNEPAESLPDGVVSGGYFYKGQKANGEYFNEEMPPEEALEVHQSHEEVSAPGKLYDDNSEHPYYVVDKPAEGPAPPPLVYFTSGLRSNEASMAAWTEYYAKLREYNDFYYPSYRRAKSQRGAVEAKSQRGAVEAQNQNLDVVDKSEFLLTGRNNPSAFL